MKNDISKAGKELMQSIKIITNDYMTNRTLDQAKWDALTAEERKDKLLTICKDVDLAIKYSERDNLCSIPDPLFSQLMNLYHDTYRRT